DELLAGTEWLARPYTPPNYVHGYQAYVCLFQPETPGLDNVANLHDRRNKLMGTLQDKGIATRQGTHAPVFQGYYARKYGFRSPLVQVSAIMYRKLDNASGLLNDYGLRCAVASDLSEVIDRVAAVIIATPPGSHYALAQFALNHDVHVLLEKPMTVRYADAL